MNIYDIADKVGVSAATVSRAINNSGYVGKKTRARIEAAIAESNFVPSGIARNLSTGANLKLIGIVCYNIIDPYYAKAVSVLQQRLEAMDYNIILSCTGESVAQKQKSVDMLIAKNADAVIFIGSVFAGKSETVVQSASKALPVFIVNAEVKGENIYCAYCDDRAAVQECTRLMIERGRRKLLYLYDVDTYGSAVKLRGYSEAMTSAGLKPRIVRCEAGLAGAQESFLTAFRRSAADCVICANDVLAAGVLNAAKIAGVSVPKQLAVVGHNNSFISELTTPKLASIDNGVERLSTIVADNIAAMFGNKAFEKKSKIPFAIHERESM